MKLDETSLSMLNFRGPKSWGCKKLVEKYQGWQSLSATEKKPEVG